MRLSELTEGMTSEMHQEAALSELNIRGLSADSRKVAPGFLFAALPGAREDGRRYIADAVERAGDRAEEPVAAGSGHRSSRRCDFKK